MDLDCREEFFNDKTKTEFDSSTYCLTIHPRPIEDAEEDPFSETDNKNFQKEDLEVRNHALYLNGEEENF